MFFSTKAKFYTSSLLGNMIHGFGTKAVGDGTDIQNLQGLLADHHVPYQSIVVPKQSHSTNVTVVGRDAVNPVSTDEDTDALVTREPGVVLSVVTADCVPTIYSDPETGVISISHGGWKGTVGNIVGNVILKMEELGAQRKSIRAAIGPAIGDCCYEIYGERLDQFQSMFGKRVITEQNDNKYLNLIKANYLLLQKAGIDISNIDYFPFCTSCQKDVFWSYHRDKQLEGEMIHFIVKQ